MPEERTPGFCALCKSRCGSVMVTMDGKFVSQEPNPQHPTGRSLCVKGRAAPELIYNEDRLLHPVMRTNPKGSPDPGWKRISWDEALDRAANALSRIRETHGAESVVIGIATPSGTPISDDIRWIERFANVFGTPNSADGTEICNWHKDHAHAYTFGRGMSAPDFEQTDCVILWGHNPSATWLDHATATAAAKARGAKLIVVDPRRVGFASRADQWLRIRPGSDGALALGLARSMIKNGLFDEAFMRDWSNGPFLVREDDGRFLRVSDLPDGVSGGEPEDFVAVDAGSGDFIAFSKEKRSYSSPDAVPQLRAAATPALVGGKAPACRSAFILYEELCESFTPEKVEEICWLPAAQVDETARLISACKSVCYYGWTGIGQHTNSTQTDRAIALLMALTGTFDAPGANVSFAKPPAFSVARPDLMGSEQQAKCIGLRHSKLGPAKNNWIASQMVYDAILHDDPYPVRAMIGFGRNFLVNHSNSQRGQEALSKLEFQLQMDVTLTPTAGYADIVLPICTPWERDSLRVGFEGSDKSERLVQYRPAAIEPLGESRSDAYVIFELAKRLGFGHLFWDGNIEAGLEYVLKPLGFGIDDLRRNPNGISAAGETKFRRYLTDGFATMTGKLEVYSELFLNEGQDPLPRFIEPAMSPLREIDERYPLVLTSAKVVQFRHSQDRQVGSLRKRSPDPEVTVHPDVARARSLEEEDWVEIVTAHGKVTMRLKLDEALDPRVVWAQYGWWQGSRSLKLEGFDPFSDDGANYNRLISDETTDPVSGAAPLRSYMCDVRRSLSKEAGGAPNETAAAPRAALSSRLH